MAKWIRICSPKNMERLKEFDLPRRWYVDRVSTAKILRDSELLYELAHFLKPEEVIFVKMFKNPEEVASVTERWQHCLVIGGHKYSAKVRKDKGLPVELAVFHN